VSIAEDLTRDREVDELRQALQRAQRLAAKRKVAADELVEAVYRAARDAALAVGKPPAVKPPAKDKRKGHHEVALVHATDWQVGKATPGYSMKVAQQRIGQLAAKVAELTEIQRTHHPVRACTLMLGGDMVEGITVFPGQAYEVEAHLFAQIFATVDIIDRLVRDLLATFETVHVACEYGNHGRIGRKGDVPGSDNVDRLCYAIAAERFADEPRVTWQQSADWHQLVEVGNYRALLVHGDEIKSFGGNTPAFGILRKCNAWATGVVAPFHDVYVGHYHHVLELTLANGGRVFVTGSPESENAYAAEFVAAKGKPSQRLHFIDPNRGRVTSQYVIWLD
jgi:hypothetical protein